MWPATAWQQVCEWLMNFVQLGVGLEVVASVLEKRARNKRVVVLLNILAVLTRCFADEQLLRLLEETEEMEDVVNDADGKGLALLLYENRRLTFMFQMPGQRIAVSACAYMKRWHTEAVRSMLTSCTS